MFICIVALRPINFGMIPMRIYIGVKFLQKDISMCREKENDYSIGGFGEANYCLVYLISEARNHRISDSTRRIHRGQIHLFLFVH
jgi:hypothetical protein